MNILILGSGGREHSLAWAVAQNPKCDRLMVAPGNAGIAKIADCVDLDILDGAAVLAFVRDQAIDFVIIGPEAPLAAGVTDVLRAADVLCFGPSQAAAQLEASKFFTKSICDAAGAPTAGYGHFTDQPSAADYVRNMGAPIVVKADGLAAGKGVIIAETEAEARDAIEDMFGGGFGTAGAEVVLEDVRVPGRCLLGGKEKLDAKLARYREGTSSGKQPAMATFEATRPAVGAQALGVARAAYEFALDYAKERKAFGKPIIMHQAIAFKLANMITEIDAARLLIWRASWLAKNGGYKNAEGSQSKYYASEMAVRVTEDAIQILGGYGYTREYPVERWHRDAKIHTIFEGTSEIQQLVIARAISGLRVE